jgi:hypothetical protein
MSREGARRHWQIFPPSLGALSGPGGVSGRGRALSSDLLATWVDAVAPGETRTFRMAFSNLPGDLRPARQRPGRDDRVRRGARQSCWCRSRAFLGGGGPRRRTSHDALGIVQGLPSRVRGHLAARLRRSASPATPAALGPPAFEPAPAGSVRNLHAGRGGCAPPRAPQLGVEVNSAPGGGACPGDFAHLALQGGLPDLMAAAPRCRSSRSSSTSCTCSSSGYRRRSCRNGPPGRVALPARARPRSCRPTTCAGRAPSPTRWWSPRRIRAIRRLAGAQRQYLMWPRSGRARAPDAVVWLFSADRAGSRPSPTDFMRLQLLRPHDSAWSQSAFGVWRVPPDGSFQPRPTELAHPRRRWYGALAM